MGYDLWPIRSSRALADGRTLFLELPDLQPVNVLHLHLGIEAAGPALDLFATIHHLGPPLLPGSAPKLVQPDPIVANLAALDQRPTPNPWTKGIAGARLIRIRADKNLTFTPRTLTARPGKAIRLIFTNPDSVPHNWPTG